jgi:hypothetical protein
MPDHDLDRDLAALARHAGRTGRLGTAADIRARGDRRRRNQRVASGALGLVLLGALGTGLAFGQAGGPRPAPPGQPGQSASPASPESILAGERQVHLTVVQRPDGVLAVGANDRVGLSADGGDRALFVLQPDGKNFRIRTPNVTKDGKAACLAVRTNGSNPLTVVAERCAADDGNQVFTLRPEGTTKGRPAYAVSNGDAYLQWSRSGNGLIAEELGDGPLGTTVGLVDQGPANLPAIGD